MFDRLTLESMRRVDLQALAKDHGIKANLKNDKIILQLLGKTDEETDDETSSLPRQEAPVATTATRSRVVSGNKFRVGSSPVATSKRSITSMDEAPTKRRRATKRSVRPAKKKQLAPTPTPGNSETESDAPHEAPKLAPNPRSKKESKVISSTRTHRVSRPSLDTPYIELPSRRLSGDADSLPVRSSSLVSIQAKDNETVTKAMPPHPTQPPSRLTAAASDVHSSSPAMFSPRTATFDVNNVVTQLQASAEYKSLLQSVETSQTMVKALQGDIGSERARLDGLQRQLELAKASMERESQEQQTSINVTLTKLDALDGRFKSVVGGPELAGLKAETEVLRSQLATTKRETDGLIESHKATVSALETYARGLEIRLKKLEEQRASPTSVPMSMGPPPPLNLGKRDRIDPPSNAEVADSPSGAPSPSKKIRYSVMSESSEEASQVDLSLMNELLAEPSSTDVDPPTSSSSNSQHPDPQRLHNRPPFSSLVPPASDGPTTSSMSTLSSLVPPPNYRPPSSLPKPQPSSTPATSMLYEPPLSELPFPLSPRKGSTDHVPLPLLAEPSPSTSPTKAGSATSPFSFSSTASGAVRKNNPSGRHNPIGRRNVGLSGNPSTPTKLVRTSAISFGQGLRTETLGTPLSTSTPARNDSGNGIGLNVTSPSATDISLGGIQMPSPRPSSSVFRLPSFTFGDSLGLGVPSSSTDTTVKDNRADPLSPAFPVDAGPRAPDPFGFDDVDASNGSGMMLDSPPPPSPAKRTMYGTEITAPSASNGLGKNDAVPIPSLASRLSPAGLSTVQEETESGLDLSGGRAGGPSGSGSGVEPKSNSSPSKYGLDTPESWGSPRR